MREPSEIPGVFVVMRPGETWDHVRAFFAKHGLASAERYERPEGINQIEEIWADPEREDVAHLIDDPVSGTHYVWLHGANEEPLALAMVIELEFFPPARLFAELDQAGDLNTVIKTLFRIAVSFANWHPQAEAAYRLYSGHPHPVVRRAALQAVAYRTIPAYRDILERAREADPDEQNRAFAAELLDGLR